MFESCTANLYVSTYIYIYIMYMLVYSIILVYIIWWRERRDTSHRCRTRARLDDTANLRTNIVDFRGFDSSTIFIKRGGIPRPIGNFPESLSQAMLVGIMLVGRLGVFLGSRSRRTALAITRSEAAGDYMNYIVLCNVVLCYAMLCYAVLCYAVL